MTQLILKPHARSKKSEMELTMEDKAQGKVIKCKDKEDLFNQLGFITAR